MISTARTLTDRRRGLVLIELLIVVSLMAMLTAAGTISFSALWGNLRFKREARRLVSFFQMAQDAASQSDRRYAVVVDFPEQCYTLRQYVTADLQTLSDDEAVIDTGYFTDTFQLDYVLFDDLDDTRDKEAVETVRFLAGRAGWQYGGKVLVRDGDGNPWSILISRLGQPVRLVEGDVGFLLPRQQNEIPF
jgi:prepilin-type N-terminal cleavage/methylation domain-containing protein